VCVCELFSAFIHAIGSLA